MKKSLILATVMGTALLYSPAMAHGPHEHGVARMNISVDGATVEIALESPLANVLSFEHAPASDAQRAEVQALAAKLRQAEKLFLLTKAAQCRSTGVSLASENLPPELLGDAAPAFVGGGGGHPEKTHDTAEDEAHEEHEAHGDLDASFTFTCDKPEALKDINVQLFTAWPALHELEIQLVTPAGQQGAELTSKKHTLVW